MNSELCLCGIAPGAKAEIVRIEGGSPFKKRLMEMGLIRGEVIEKVKLAPLADPAEYIIKGYHISLRNAEARDIIVRIAE
ncbi:MAG: ferrous iron transport protein A [Phycisphaerae bacterium]|nr:ferrous iron transport protein A [Phycisphaerae bacterium]